jgi:heme/copper-type cytochrome/quinol oxidase subunit 3
LSSICRAIGFSFDDATNARCKRRTRALLTFFLVFFLFLEAAAFDDALAGFFTAAFEDEVLADGFCADWPHAQAAQSTETPIPLMNVERITTISV